MEAENHEHQESQMSSRNSAEAVDRDRRRLLGMATIGLAVAGAASLLPSQLAATPTASLENATEWLNSPPLTASALRGKVVLVDVWTYTCINWLRTLPYIRAWEQKYRDQGLVVIGVHAPEFM